MPIPKYYVRPDGLHESIITVNGKRKAFRGKTDREVWNKIKAYRAEAEKPKTVPFSDVAHAWWNEIEPTLAPNSLRNYSPAYERAVAQFGPEDVATITSKEIETYINQFAKTRAKKTVITQRQIIRQILNKAQREGYVSFNAAQAVLLPKNLPQKHRHAPPADQIQKIKDNLNDDFGLFAFLVYYTGCRRGEALALTGATLAYLITHTDPVPNRFTPAHVSCTVKEEFDGTTKKNVNVTNTGDIDAYLRVKLVTYRVNDDGQHIGGTAAIPAFTPGDGWAAYGDYYYYTYPVAPGQQPEPPLIDSLTLTGSYSDADGGKQALEIMAEAIQSAPTDALGQAWGVTITPGHVAQYQ